MDGLVFGVRLVIKPLNVFLVFRENRRLSVKIERNF